MRKLILIAFIFSLQILQGQVSVELLWERTFFNTIASISHDNIDSNFFVVYGINNGSGLHDKTQISKLEPRNGSSLITSDYFRTRKVYLSPIGTPLYSLDFENLLLCGVDSVNLNVSNSCFDSYLDFQFNGFQVFQSKDLSKIYLTSQYLKLNDTFQCKIYNIENKTIEDSLKLYIGQNSGIKISNFIKSHKNNLSIVAYIVNNGTPNTHLAILGQDSKLILKIDSLDIEFTLNNFNLEIANFSISSDEKYLFYFKNNILYSLDLKTFENKIITKSNLPLYKNFTMSSDDKYLLINTQQGIYHYEFASNTFTKLTNDIAKSISFTENQYSFYVIVGNDKLKKYKLNLTSSVNEEENESKLSISPNPTSDFINIAGVEPETRLEFTNMLGETVWSGIGVKQISTQTLPNGTYFLKTTKGSQVKSQKVLVWR